MRIIGILIDGKMMVEEVLMHKGGNILSPFKNNETFFYVGRMISRQVLFKKGRNDFLNH